MAIIHIRFLNRIGGVESFLGSLIHSTGSKRCNKFSYLLIGSKENLNVHDSEKKAIQIVAENGYGIFWRYELIKKIKLLNPNYIVFHGVPPITMCLIYFLACRKFCVYDHGTFNLGGGVLKYLKNILTIIEIKLFSQSIITNSEFGKKLIQKHIGRSKPIHIVPLFANLPYVNQKKTAKEILVGYLGRISFSDKGTDLLVNLASEFKIKGSNLKFLVAGVGPDLSELRKIIDQKEINDYFIFAGNVSDKIDFFSKINCLISTSRTETFGLTIMEAIHQRVPVCAFDVGSLREIFGNYSTVKLINPYDIGKACETIEYLACVVEFSDKTWCDIHLDLKNKYSIDAFNSSLLGLIGGSYCHNSAD